MVTLLAFELFLFVLASLLLGVVIFAMAVVGLLAWLAVRALARRHRRIAVTP